MYIRNEHVYFTFYNTNKTVTTSNNIVGFTDIATYKQLLQTIKMLVYR